jgi:hypothetical protein
MPFIDSFLAHRLVPLLWHVLEWLAESLPDMVNLILVLVGVIMSLPKLAEKIEDHAKAWYTLAAGCIVLGLAGFVASVHQRHQFNFQITQLVTNDNQLVTNTNNLVTSTNTVVTDFGILMPQLAGLRADQQDIATRLLTAREKHDPHAIASLESQAAAAQAQVTNLSRTMALSIGPGIVTELRHWGERWQSDETTLHNKIQNVYSSYPPELTPEQSVERRDRLQSLNALRSNLNENYARQVLPILTSANYLREELLRGSQQTDEDKRAALIFAKPGAGLPMEWDDIQMVGGYMMKLLNKVATPAPPVGLKATVP